MDSKSIEKIANEIISKKSEKPEKLVKIVRDLLNPLSYEEGTEVLKICNKKCPKVSPLILSVLKYK
jgi:predicted transcriptional regulator